MRVWIRFSDRLEPPNPGAYPQYGTLIWMGGIFSLRSSFLWIVFRAHLTLSFLCDGTLQLYLLLLLFIIEPTLPKELGAGQAASNLVPISDGNLRAST